MAVAIRLTTTIKLTFIFNIVLDTIALNRF